VRKPRKRLLTTKEAAEYLGVSVLTLYRTEKTSALLPYRTPGGHRRYSVEMLDEYLENSRKQSNVSARKARSRTAKGGREVDGV